MKPALGYAPHYSEVKPYPGAPRFFARIYDLSQSYFMGVDRAGNAEMSRPYGTEFQPLEIIGFAAMSTYPEDKPLERTAFENGHFMAWCFSRMEPQGEYGFVPLSECREINEPELKNALTNLGLNLGA